METSNDDIVADTEKGLMSHSERLTKKRNQRYSSNADKLQWIPYIKEDIYVLMHKYNNNYYFKYTEEELQNSFFMAVSYMQE